MELTKIKLGADDQKKETQEHRENLAKITYNLDEILKMKENSEQLSLFEKTRGKDILGKLRNFEELDFSDSFMLMSYVISGTNKQFYHKNKEKLGRSYINLDDPDSYKAYDSKSASEISRMILEAFTLKEANKGLNEEEISGVSAATMMDLVYRLDVPDAIDTCGMGADKGKVKNGKKLKTINVSTLSSIILASLGCTTIKHGSYKNTAAMGSTDAIMNLGVNINQDSKREIDSLVKDHRYLYADAHLYKTIHDSSHLVKVETINHIIGPMTTPVSKDTKLHRVLGVNEKIHPRKIALAYEILNKKGFQKVGNAAIVAGLDEDYNCIDAENQDKIKKHIILDELSPYSSIVSFVQNGAYSETRILKPEDFGIALDPDKIFIDVNDKETLSSKNRAALYGEDEENAKYLAMNSALALYVKEYGNKSILENGKIKKDLLNHCYLTCLQAIKSGLAADKINKYACATQREFINSIKENFIFAGGV